MMLFTIVDMMSVFPFDYSKMDTSCETIPYGYIEKTTLPSGQCVSRIFTTDLKQYLPEAGKLKS